VKTLAFFVLSLFVVALPMTAPAGAAASGGDPAVQQIEKFHAALLGVMKQGAALGAEGRFKKLAPQIDATFDLAAMTQYAVGPTWSTMSDAEHKTLIEGFRRMTIANYAHNFASFNGQKFVVDPTVEAHDADHLVHSQLIPVGDKPVSLTYRMRNSGGTWKVIDVFLEGYVSELATRRSDFAATVQSGGAAALSQKLSELSDKLMKD
jgi:phospholipid transport system substrate-binding protein